MFPHPVPPAADGHRQCMKACKHASAKSILERAGRDWLSQVAGRSAIQSRNSAAAQRARAGTTIGRDVARQLSAQNPKKNPSRAFHGITDILLKEQGTGCHLCRRKNYITYRPRQASRSNLPLGSTIIQRLLSGARARSMPRKLGGRRRGGLSVAYCNPFPFLLVLQASCFREKSWTQQQ